MSAKLLRSWKGRRPEGRWSGWVGASGLLHALLLGGLVSLMESATRSPAILRARLVTEIEALSVSRPERQPPPTLVSSSTLPSFPGKLKRPSTPFPPGIVGITAEPSAAKPVPSPATDREMAGLPITPAPPAGGSRDEGAASPPSGPMGEGETRFLSPRSGPHASQAEPASSPADEGRVDAPPHLDAAARGISLVPGGGGSGTGRTGLGAAGQGSGSGGGGAGWGRDAGSGGSGSGGTGLASRGGTAGSGDGDGVADLLRSIRRQIEQAKIYPEAARRQGIQGTVELRFRIAADGSVETLEVLRSSGFPLLDEASQQTVRRAAPYPLIRGWVRLPLSYRLDQ